MSGTFTKLIRSPVLIHGYFHSEPSVLIICLKFAGGILCEKTLHGHHKTYLYIDGLVQDCSNSIANALELLQSCTKPSIWHKWGWVCWGKSVHVLVDCNQIPWTAVVETRGKKFRLHWLSPLVHGRYQTHTACFCFIHWSCLTHWALWDRAVILEV